MDRISQALEAARRRLEAADWPGAERLCRQAVEWEPGHAGARHLLGSIAARTGRDDLAISSGDVSRR